MELESHSKVNIGVSGAVILGLKCKGTWVNAEINGYDYHHNLARTKRDLKEDECQKPCDIDDMVCLL